VLNRIILICEHVGFKWENNTDVEASVNVDPFKLCRTVLLDLEGSGHGIIEVFTILLLGRRH
jgi:hypothetical protein